MNTEVTREDIKAAMKFAMKTYGIISWGLATIISLFALVFNVTICLPLIFAVLFVTHITLYWKDDMQ